MSSPRSKQLDEFDATIGHELKSWAAHEQAPAHIRKTLLEKAARQSGVKAADVTPRKLAVLKRMQNWLIGPARSLQAPNRVHDLSQWLFTQAAWHNLGNDRRAVRFVC